MSICYLLMQRFIEISIHGLSANTWATLWTLMQPFMEVLFMYSIPKLLLYCNMIIKWKKKNVNYSLEKYG